MSIQIQPEAEPELLTSSQELNHIITLKNLQLNPTNIKISINDLITIKIAHNNSYSNSQFLQKKFIFTIQEIDQQTNPLGQDDSYTFMNKFQSFGQHKLICVNFPKLCCIIEVQKSSSQSQQLYDEVHINQFGDNFSVRPLSPLKLTQVKEQHQEQQPKQYENSPFCKDSPTKSISDLAQYERILSEGDSQSDNIQNRYIKYFKEEFRLWRNFFEEEQKKENLKGKHTKNLSLSEVKEIDYKRSAQEDQEDSDECLQYLGSQKNQRRSIASQLYSHQQIMDRQEQMEVRSVQRPMKKTNSEYAFNINIEKDPLEKASSKEESKLKSNQKERESQIPLQNNNIKKNNQKKHNSVKRTTQTNSPCVSSYKKQNNFLSWAIGWSAQKDYPPVYVKPNNDAHLVNQLSTYLKNKFNLAQFMYC